MGSKDWLGRWRRRRALPGPETASVSRGVTRRRTFAALFAGAPLWALRSQAETATATSEPGATTLYTARSIEIPRHIDLLAISGIATTGDAGAGMMMVRDSMVDTDYVATHPSTSFVDLGGNGFRHAGALWGFRQPITEALVRMGEGKLGERVSWLDFLPSNMHAGILAHTNNDDLSERLQAMLDALPSSARLYIPGRVNIERGLRCSKSITLYGDAGRENFDNSWDHSKGGSQILFRADRGDGFTFAPPEDEGCNINVVLRDFIVRGNRLRDDGRPNPMARSGRGIVFRGGSGHATNLRVDADNVHVAQAVDSGVALERTVFGGSLRNMFLHRNGGNGLSTDTSNGVGIGEMWLARLRLFQNGQSAANAEKAAGFFWKAGSFLASQISASNNAGAGVVISGGPFEINMLQMESNGEAAGSRARQLILGQPDAGIVAARISSLLSAPQEGYNGAHIEIMGTSKNVHLSGYLSGDLGPSGHHLIRRAGSEQIDISGLRGAIRNIDESTDFSTIQRCQVFSRQNAALSAVTGNGAEQIWAPGNLISTPGPDIFDPASGIFTAPINGIYSAEILIPLTNISAEHVSCTLQAIATTFSRTVALGNLGQLHQGPEGNYALRFHGDLPLRQGDKLQFRFSVTGGKKSVSVQAIQGYLSIRAV